MIAAKTYLLEKKFNKAIAILTDLCYVIPPDMLKINEDNANIAMHEDENLQELGGIRFCNQVLMDEEDDDYYIEDDKSDEDDFINPAADVKKKANSKFTCKILVDKDMEN